MGGGKKRIEISDIGGNRDYTMEVVVDDGAKKCMGIGRKTTKNGREMAQAEDGTAKKNEQLTSYERRKWQRYMREMWQK